MFPGTKDWSVLSGVKLDWKVPRGAVARVKAVGVVSTETSAEAVDVVGAVVVATEGGPGTNLGLIAVTDWG